MCTKLAGAVWNQYCYICTYKLIFLNLKLDTFKWATTIEALSDSTHVDYMKIPSILTDKHMCWWTHTLHHWHRMDCIQLKDSTLHKSLTNANSHRNCWSPPRIVYKLDSNILSYAYSYIYTESIHNIIILYYNPFLTKPPSWWYDDHTLAPLCTKLAGSVWNYCC